MKRVQAHYSDKSGHRATRGRIKRKTTRRASTESEEDGSRSHGASKGTLMSFERVLARGSVHTAECCRLSLPREFCERFDVGGAVTATDSGETRLWHMRFQSSARGVFIISNGWREFSYDHGLKVCDLLVFTLLSASHFRVEFANSARKMLAIRDGAEYPWRPNRYRLDCLLSVRIKDGFPVAENGNEENRQKSVGPITSQGVIHIRAKDEDVIRKDIADEEHVRRLIQIRLADEDARLKREAAAGAELLRKNMATADHQTLHKMEMFCQCGDMAMAPKAAVKYVIPKLTHLECKNADGSSYLQIIDSESET